MGLIQFQRPAAPWAPGLLPRPNGEFADGLKLLLLPGRTRVDLAQNRLPTTAETGTTPPVPGGVGLNVTATGRRYSFAPWVENERNIAWLVVAHRNNAATGTYRSVVRQDLAVVPLQEEDTGNVRAAAWAGGFVYIGSYGTIAGGLGNRTSSFAGRVDNSTQVIYANGGAPVTMVDFGASSRGTNDFCIGATESGTEVASQWTTLLVAAWQGVIPSVEALYRLQRDPRQLFEPQRIWVPVAAAGGDASAALSGQAAAASAGTLAPSLTVALTGQAVTATAGTLAQSLSVALSGVAANASAGTVTPSRTKSLSGEAVTTYAGTLTYTLDTDITLALSGQAVAATAGTLAPSSSKAISGQAVTASAGTLSPAVSAALAGVAVAASAGTVVPSSSLALLGQSVTGSAGTITYVADGDIVLALTGEQVTTYAGTLTIAESFSSGSVIYLPIRMVAGLWSVSGVPASQDLLNLQAWLPPIRQPISTTVNGQTYMDPTWYRFFQFVAETKLGGIKGPTLPDVVSAVTSTQATAAASSATVAAVAQQAQTNAEALSSVKTVVQTAALPGSNQIPPVDTSFVSHNFVGPLLPP